MALRGSLDPATLAREAGSGEIETVITALPDLYGRLVGKRIQAGFYCDEIAAHGLRERLEIGQGGDDLDLACRARAPGQGSGDDERREDHAQHASHSRLLLSRTDAKGERPG